MAKPKDNRDLYKLAYEDNYYERTDTYSKGKSKPKKKKSVKKSYKDYDRYDNYW